MAECARYDSVYTGPVINRLRWAITVSLQHNSPTTSDLNWSNLSAGPSGFGSSNLRVPSSLMPSLCQNSGILVRCGCRRFSYLRAKMSLELRQLREVVDR